MLDKMQHGLDLIQLYLGEFTVQALMNIVQRFGQVTAIIDAIDDRQADLLVGVGQVGTIQLLQQVVVQCVG